MSYTDYGLTEGLAMLAPTIIVITVLYFIIKIGASAPYRKQMTLIYCLSLLMLALDTLMWAFDIQTNVIDFLITSSDGTTEQMTIFGVAMIGLVLYMVASKDEHKEDSTETKE